MGRFAHSTRLRPCYSPPLEQPPVHWSYWSRGATPYDRFAVGEWRRARVADAPPEPIAPYAMRLVRSTDVFDDLCAVAEPVEWLRTTARSIARRGDLYEVATDDGTFGASWVFDSAPEVAPEFPSPNRPHARRPGAPSRSGSGSSPPGGVAFAPDTGHGPIGTTRARAAAMGAFGRAGDGIEEVAA